MDTNRTSRVWQLPTLPFDVHGEIISIVDFPTLKACSSLSRAHREEAARRLWKTFTIAAIHPGSPEDARGEIEARANFISHGSRAPRVRKLRVFINAALALWELDPEAHPTIQAVGLAMSATNNVVTLDVRGPYHGTLLGEEMSALPPSWAPDLRSITTSLSCGNALATFWTFHRRITELELLFGEDCTQPLIYSPLPHLTTMKVATPAQTFCVGRLHAPQGSPLESISIRSFRDLDAPSLGANLSHVFTTLTHLDIAVHPSSPPSIIMYEQIISRFINLRRLQTNHPQLRPEDAIRALAASHALKQLEEFEWNGIGRFSPSECDVWVSQCMPSVLRLVFKWHIFPEHRWITRVFERSSPSSPWVCTVAEDIRLAVRGQP